MNTTQKDPPISWPGRCLGATVLAIWLAAAGLGGCAYLDRQLQASSTPTPDPRIKLGWRDRVYLYEREIPSYTCEAHYVLQCERGGSVTYSCTCALR